MDELEPGSSQNIGIFTGPSSQQTIVKFDGATGVYGISQVRIRNAQVSVVVVSLAHNYYDPFWELLLNRSGINTLLVC
jgi:hypothetical protein